MEAGVAVATRVAKQDEYNPMFIIIPVEIIGSNENKIEDIENRRITVTILLDIII